jgi:hypothetical protein
VSLASEVLDTFRKIATNAEGTPYATAALADAEHLAALIPAAATETAEAAQKAEASIVSWLTRRLHPEAAAPAVPPAKPVTGTAAAPSEPVTAEAPAAASTGSD